MFIRNISVFYKRCTWINHEFFKYYLYLYLLISTQRIVKNTLIVCTLI